MSSDLILAGDIGGTKSLLALFEESGDDRTTVVEQSFASQSCRSLEDVVARFLRTHGDARPRAACFGVPGLVTDGRCHPSNLGWNIDERIVAATCGIGRVKLLNDLEAAALGMICLRPNELVPLNPAAVPAEHGNVAVIGPGTGLGEALLYWDGTHHQPIATEGGHADFAPRTDQEVALLRYLRAQFGHVSWERVASGQGIHNIYAFLRDTGVAAEPAWLAARLQAEDPNAVIGEVALSGTVPLCTATVDQFASILGAEAGNLALKCLAFGGVYVSGGIAPKILPLLQNGHFLRAFTDKGRFAEMLERLPVSVAVYDRAPLCGAAHYARRQ